MYNWQSEAVEKYGQEVTNKLIEEQQRYEAMKKGNNCTSCGTGNQGSVVYIEEIKRPMIVRYGNFNGKGRCLEC